MQDKQIKDVHRELFNRTFLVYMPYSATVSRNELMEYGVVGLHTKDSLERYLSDPILVNATIVQIAETISGGDEVSLRNNEDAATIYDLIIQHLENWLYIGHTHMASRLPPLPDLIALDELAGVLYKHITPVDAPVANNIDYALGNDLLLGMMTHAAPQNTKHGYKPYASQFIELGVPEI